jgi:LytS/YehU family sensor histidine kinase
MNHKHNFDWLLGGLLLALAIALPLAFHLVGLGSAFLPMFYPVMLAGLLLRPQVSLLVGLLAPLLSAALTGMPPFYPPVAFIMLLEFLVMTAMSWALFQKLHLNIYLSLFLTILAERLVLLLATWLVADWLKLPGIVLGPITLIKGLPGIIVMSLAIPPLVIKINEKRRLSPFLQPESPAESEIR